MRAVLLDYHGTLTRMSDRAAFVQQLVDQGDYVALHTGTDNNIPEAVKSRCHAVFIKGEKDITQLVSAVLADSEETVREIIIVDDDPAMLRAFARRTARLWLIYGMAVGTLHADDIEDLLDRPNDGA